MSSLLIDSNLKRHNTNKESKLKNKQENLPVEEDSFLLEPFDDAYDALTA